MRIKHIFLLVSFFFTFGLFAQNATFQAVDSTQCPGSLFILTANNTTYPSAAYAWQITSPTGVVSNYSGNDTIGIVLTSPGLYDVKLTVTSGGTASVTKLDYLTVYAKPSIIYSVTPTTGCSPMNVVFNGSCTAGSGSIVSYSINTANGFISSAEDFSYTYTNTTSGNLIFKPKATVTNSVGCFDTLTLATITVKPSPSLSSPTNPNAVCSGSTFNYTPTSTTAGCTFSWTRPAIPNITPNTGSGTGNISETLTNTSGSNILVTYNVTTTAPNGCSTTQAVLVTVRALPTVTIDSPTLTVCNGSSDTITATASGTTGTFSWSNGLSTPSIIVSAAGTYTVTYSDGFCSSASAVSVVTLTAPPTITNSTLGQNVCTGVATTAVPWTSSLSGTTYAWTATATPAASLTGFSSSGTGNLPVMTINSTSSSNATVTYTVTPTANGCAGPQVSYVITIYPKPVNNYTIATNNACSSPVTTSYTSTSTNAAGGVSWTFPGGSPATYTGAGPVPVTYNSSGNYSITMTSTSAFGCITTTTFANTITVGSGVPPTGTITSTTPISQCLTGNSFCFNFSGTGADTLRWDWGDGSAFQYTDPLVNPTCHTFNTVGTFVVTMIPFKTVGPVLSCSGTATQITVIVKGPVASFTASTVDCDNQLTRTFTNASTGTTASTTYAWTFGDPGSGAANNSTLASPSHTFSSYSSLPYTVTLTAADATTGCSNSTATASISCYPNNLSSFQAFNPSCVPTWNGTSFTPATCIATNEVCLGGILSFVNTTPSPQLGTTGSSSNFTQWDWNPTNGYQWSTGTYFKGTPRAYTFSETPILQSTNIAWTPGIYPIAMRNRRDNVTTIGTNSTTVSCYQIVTNTIKVNGIIGTFSAPDTVCVGSSFTATDNSTAPVTSIVSRLWNWGDGTTTSGNVSNPSHTYSTPGVYTITLTVTDASVLACTKTTTRTIIVRKPTASFTINRNFICNNQTVVVSNNSTGVGLSTYNWSATNASPATATGSSFGTFTFTQQGNQTITLTVTDNLGCVDDTTIAISVFDVLAAANPPTATFSCFNSSPPNQVTFTNLSTNNVDISSAQWNFGNGQTSTAWSPSTTYTLPGTYPVFLTVTSLTGCTSTQQVSTITVGGPSATLDITNANLAGCSCYNATISISTSNVSSVSFFPYGSGTFSSVSPNTTQNITQSYCNTSSSPTTVTPAVYISGNSGCNGLINFTETITINPVPAITAMTSVVCSQVAFSVTPVNVTNGVVPTGTTYSWSAPVAAGITGLSSGTNATSISGTLTNTTNAPINVVYTVTPTSGSCAGSSFTVTITVNPKPAITAMTSVVCSQVAFSVTPVNVTNGVVPTGTTYSWSAPVAAGITGLSSGTNATSISGTLTNTTNAPINVVYTVTPTSGSCAGSSFTVTITVNPKPAITAMTSVVCSQVAFSVTPVNVTNGVVPTGTTYSWSAPVAAGITGLSSGTNATSISGTLTNTTNAPINVVYTVTPTSGSCAGSSFTVTITVNPKPAITAMTSVVCSQVAFSVTPVNVTNGVVPTGTTYSWSAPVAAGITGLSSGTNATSISGTLTNTTNAPINVVYTVTPTSGSCAGSSFTVTITVNPKPAITAMTSVVCSQVAFSVTPVNVTNGVVPTGTTYSWSAPVAAGITGLLSGTNATSISGTLTNTTNAPINVVYTVTPTSGSCAGSSFTVTITVNPLPTFTATPTNPTLCNGTNGSILLTGLQNSVSYTYSLNGASAVAVTSSASGQVTISSLGAGTYTLTVTLVSTGCTSSSQSITLTNPGAPNVNDITDQVLCGGSYTLPVITGTNLSGNQAYYTGPNGTGTSIAAGTAISTSQTIYIYGSTPGGCSDQETFTVTINPLPTISGTLSVCVGSTTQLTGSGTANASSPWASSTPANATVSSTGLVTGVSVGSSTITYTDNNGCQKTAIVTVNPLPTFTATPTNPTLCNGTNGSILLTGLQNSVSYTYSLNGASAVAVTSSASGQVTISSLGAGTYTLTVTLVSTGCTSSSQSITLTNPGAPNVNDITDQVLCGGSYTLPVITGTNLSGNQAYYTGPNGTGTSIAAGTAISTSQTIYIYGSTPGGCSDQETFTVTINPLPTISGTLSVCVGSTTQLTGSGTANASSPWASSTPANATVSSTGLVTGVSVGSSTITYTDNNGCQKTAIVTVNPLPTFTATPTNPTLCNGTNGSILLTGLQNSVSYTYSLNGASAVAVTSSASGQVTISSLGAGTYTLTVTLVSTGCTSSSQSITLTNPGAPNVNDITDQVLCGGSYTLPVITGTNLSGNQAYYTGPNGTGTSIAAGTAISTSQTIYIYGSTPGGCSDQETFTVTINPLPTISGTLSVCVGSTTQLTGSGTANASSPWASSTPANATVSSTGLVTGVSVGSSTITYTDNNGCQKTAIVTVNPLPTFTATPTNPTLCNGTNGSILLTGLQNSVSYTYSLNGASAVAVTSSASGQVTISSLGAGTYTLTVTLVSTGCTSSSQSITLTNPGAPNVNDITDQVLCGGSYTLPVITGTNLSGNQAYYTGPNGTGTSIAAGTAISTSQTIYIYGSTPGGCSDQETFTVTIQTIPILSAGSTLCVGNTLQLSASTSGTWVSNTPSIASVIPTTGLATGLLTGNVTFTFTDSSTGCTANTSTVSVNATPTANAGADLTICSTTSFVNLTGSFGGSASSVVWTGGNGGVFSSPATVNTTYTFSSADVSAGSVWLYLTTNDPVGDCSFAKDSLLITINPSAIVNAGVDQVTCGTTPVSLSGTVGGAGTTATWSTTNGTGTFSSNNSLNASYTPSLADISTVYINIILTSNDPSGPCPAVTDTVVISVDPPATANAGLDFVSCSNTPINLNGIFGGSASTGIWSGSSNPVVNNPTTSNVIYTPSVAEVSSGSVILTFTTNDPAGSCLAVSDQVQISFSTPAIVNAGNDTTICSGSNVGLNGTFGGLATSATWSSGGTPPGVFTGSSFYTPSAAEIAAGTAVLTYTTNNPAGPCPAVSDQKIITINPTPTVAGLTPITVCSGTPLNQLLTGVVSSNYTWIANDNPQTVGETTTLQTTASITDVITNQTTVNQVVIYTITPTAVGSGCVGVPQTLAVTVKPTPTLLDPADQTLCANTSTLAVPFTSNLPGTTFAWTISPANVNIGLSNGNGTSIPSFTALNTFTTSIVATVTVTPTSALSCAGTPQVFTYTILPVSTVVDPSDQVICAGASTASVNFTGSDPATVYNWSLNNTTIGAGLVSPNSGNIASFVGINNGTTDVTGTFTVTPSLNNCLGTPQTFTITVKPLPIMQTPVSQTVCVGNSTTPVVFSSSILGTTYSWTNSNSSIGLPAASVGNVTFIPSFISQNSGNIIDTANIIVTPSFNGCAGSAVSFQFIVNPILQVTPITNVVYCAGDVFPGVSFTGNVPTANYSWSTDNVSIGFPVSGQSNVPGINSFTTQNSGSLIQVANVTVTPSLPGCQGTPFTFTITVKPLPTVYIAPLTQSHCNGSSTVAVDFTGNLDPLTTYSWTQTNTSISTVLLGSGTNDIPSFIATNTGLISQTSEFIVVPTYNGCTGIQDTFSITVNPIPTVANVLDQNWCAGQPSDPVNFTGSLGSAATYNWTQTNQYIGNTLVPTVGDIPSFTTQNLSTIIQTDTITVTPSFNGCNGTPEVFVITVRPTPTVYPVSNQSHCVYAYTNPVLFNGNMGTTATYAWVNNNTVINSSISSGNDSIPSFQVQNPGNTIVVATFTITPEAYGCYGTPGTFTISSVDPIPTVIPTADIILCAGSQTGTIDFQPNDPTITYHWTNDNISIGLVGAGTNDISNFQLQNTGIANQTAHVIVTPEYNGCFGLSDTFDITVKPIPNVFITPLYDSLCANQNTAYVDFTGDIAGTNYSWTNNNTLIGLGGSGNGDIASFVATNIGNNIQTATITVTPDFNGCSGTPQTTTITVNPISTVVLPTQPIYYCHGDSINDIIFNGNNPGTIYQWTNNNTAINLPSSGVGNILSFPVTNTDVVNYEAIITVQPVLNGCPGTLDSFKIIVKPIPTVYTPANQFLCANQPSALVDFQGNMTDSTVFNWFNTNVSIGLLNPTLTGGSGNIPSFVATNIGQLTQVADVIVVPTLNGCVGVADTFQYTVYPISTVNLVNDTVCTGDFVNQLNFVGSNPTATYEWTCYNSIGLNPLTGFDSIPGFTAFNSGTTPQDGLIVVTPYVGGCPGVNDTLHIVVNPRPIITSSPDQIVCSNDITAPIVFGSNISGTTYTWQNSNISIGLVSSGTTDISSFTAINTDATGLISQIGTIIVTPNYNGCSGLNDTLNITVNPLPVVNAGLDTTLCFGQHLILTGSGTATTYSWDNGAINGVPYYPSATTLFTVVGTDNNLCQNTDQILVTYLLDLPPVVSAGPDTAICFSQSITLNGSGNALVYNWNNNVLDGQPFYPAQTDTYIVIGTAANGCIASDTMELIVHPLPIVSINVVDSILCAGEQALLWGSGAVTYVWDNNVINNVPFTPNATDTYTMIGYDQFGCTDTASITVVVNPMPNVLFSSDMNFGGCLPFSPTFTDQTGANGNGPTSASVMWYFGNGTSSNQLGSVTNIYDSYGCYDVTLVSTTAEACTDSLTLQDFVCVNELVASFTPDPLSQPISNPVFDFTNTSQNATDFQWFFGDGTESDFVSTSHMYDSIGCYQVILVASAQDGCTDTAVQVVCVKDEVIIYVPNTFTPDGDRLNDVFLPILTAGYRPGTYEFAIYNRWGERFFYTEDVDQGWDGTFKGNQVQVGTYTYTIKFKSSMDNNVYTYNGHVNLIR